MTKRSKVSRQDKAEQGLPREVKSKFQSIPTLQPLNEKQRIALELLETKDITFLSGSAGTGKSYLAAYKASKLLVKNETKQIYLVRPAVSVGKSVGLLPGTLEEKLAPYFAQTISHLNEFLGKGKVDCDMGAGSIKMLAVEFMRGMSLDNCVAIFEEAQNFTKEEIEMLVTRKGENAKFIFTGDVKQKDLRGTSGMQDFIDKVYYILDKQPEYMSDELLDFLEFGIGAVEFTPEDVVRSNLTKALVTMYYHEE